MDNEGSILDQAIGQISDEALRKRIAREVELLRGSRRFGLVFDRHLPEAVRLPAHPIRKGVRVGLRDESSSETWRVVGFAGRGRDVAVLDGDRGEMPVAELVAIREFGEPIFPGLRSVERIEKAGTDSPWQVVINGENYHALQALRTTHRGQVDLIYIDPPYNTGNDGWIYNDQYVDGNDRARSSKWLSFMERRLLIARDLLKSTGVIIVAIGDDEHHRLRMLLDQVFGPQNFLANFVWIGSVKGDARYSGGGLDYMLTYSKSEEALTASGVVWREPKAGMDDLLAAGAEAWAESGDDPAAASRLLSRWWSQNKHKYDPGLGDNVKVDADGSLFKVENLVSPNPRPNLRYDLLHPVTALPVRMNSNGWRYSRETMDALVAEGRILFGEDHTSGARKKTPLTQMALQVARPTFQRDRRAASRQLELILGERRFPYPKDHGVLARWIRMLAKDDAVVLDFFGGSGSTAEAVLRLNEEDQGRRQCILVTNNEVGPKRAKALRKQGRHPGDPEWEGHGVFEAVTRPRLSTVTTGRRPDGSTYSDGLCANVEMFDLTYLDPGKVRRGREFSAIAPLLWLEAGAAGDRIDSVPEEGWALTATYGVLFTLDVLVPFARAVVGAASAGTPPEVVFVVTDSATEYQHAVERLPVGVKTVRLFEDYLANYTVNTEDGPR